MAVAKRNVTFVQLQHNFTFLIRYALMVALIASSTAWAQDKAAGLTTGADQTRVSKVRTLENEDVLESQSLDDSVFLASLGGVAFPPGAHTLLVLEDPPSSAATVVVLGPTGDEPRTIELPIADPINLAFAFQSTHSSLLLLARATGELIVISRPRARELAPPTITRVGIAHLGVQDPRGLTIDSARGRLYLLDGAGPRIIRLDLGPEPTFDVLGGQISLLALPWGLAVNPATGHLFVFSPSAHTLWELTETGAVVATHDLSGLNLGAAPQGLVFAPSLDGTDDPSVMHLFMATRGGVKGEVLELAVSPPGE